MKSAKNAIAGALALVAVSALAIGAAFTLTSGPAAFIGGLAAFLALGLIASTLNPTI